MLKTFTDASNPLNCIVKTLSFVTDGRPDVTLDLSGKAFFLQFLKSNSNYFSGNLIRTKYVRNFYDKRSGRFILCTL